MHEALLRRLQKITPEEQAILEGRTTIDRALYMQGPGTTIQAQKLLEAGKLITIRPNTRFIHFPQHTHDYVEMVYMCSGSTTHIVGGKELRLRAGNLLFLSQRATHEVYRAERTDVAVNFIVLPAFFAATLSWMGDAETPLRRFLVDCLCGEQTGPGFLHFDVADNIPIQNLLENLLLILMDGGPNKRRLSQMTMALLFNQLVGQTEALLNDDQEESAVIEVLRYVETHYASGSFSELAQQLHYAPSWLSREIRRKIGKTYTQLLQEKRLAQAADLLKNTRWKVADISAAVGYENISYFHRLFQQTYGVSPKHYRDREDLQERTLF